MKLTRDYKCNVAYLFLCPSSCTDPVTRTLREGSALSDWHADGRIHGLEFFEAEKQVTGLHKAWEEDEPSHA